MVDALQNKSLGNHICTSHDLIPSTKRPLGFKSQILLDAFHKNDTLFGRCYLYIIIERVKGSEVIDNHMDKCLFSLNES